MLWGHGQTPPSRAPGCGCAPANQLEGSSTPRSVPQSLVKTFARARRSNLPFPLTFYKLFILRELFISSLQGTDELEKLLEAPGTHGAAGAAGRRWLTQPQHPPPAGFGFWGGGSRTPGDEGFGKGTKRLPGLPPPAPSQPRCLHPSWDTASLHTKGTGKQAPRCKSVNKSPSGLGGGLHQEAAGAAGPFCCRNSRRTGPHCPVTPSRCCLGSDGLLSPGGAGREVDFSLLTSIFFIRSLAILLIS